MSKSEEDFNELILGDFKRGGYVKDNDNNLIISMTGQVFNADFFADKLKRVSDFIENIGKSSKPKYANMSDIGTLQKYKEDFIDNLRILDLLSIQLIKDDQDNFLIMAYDPFEREPSDLKPFIISKESLEQKLHWAVEIFKLTFSSKSSIFRKSRQGSQFNTAYVGGMKMRSKSQKKRSISKKTKSLKKK